MPIIKIKKIKKKMKKKMKKKKRKMNQQITKIKINRRMKSKK